VNKLKIKYQYLTGLVLNKTGLVLIILTLIAFVQTIGTSEPARAASANQAIKSSSIKLPGEGPDPVAFSPDGNTLASADSDGQIMLWDVVSGQMRMTLPSQFANPVSDIVFSRDGNTLASVSDNSIRLWDVTSGDARLILPKSGVVTDLAFSPDGKSLAAVGQDARITLWNSQSGSITQVIASHQGGVNAIAFSPDSTILAIGGQDAQINLWNKATGLKQVNLPGVVDTAVTDLLFSPDGKTLAAVDQNARITLWNSQSGSTSQILTGHQNGVNAIAFSPNSKILATGGQDAQIKLWDRTTGKEQANLPGESGVAITGLVFNPDGKTLASVGESEPVFLWDVSNQLPQLLTGHTDWVDKVIFNSNQKTLASVGKTGQVVVWDLMTGLERLFFQVPSLGAASVNPQGLASGNSITNTATAVAAGPGLPNENGQAVKGTGVNQSTKSPNKKKSNHDWKGVTALAISPDGALYGGTTRDGKVRLWTSAGKERFAISGHHGATVTGVVFSADGKNLVSVGRDTEIQIRDVANGKKGRTLLAHEHPIRAVAASPDGQFLASAGEETRIMLWDAQSGKLIRILSGHTDFVNAVSFSPDGKRLASAGADGRILLWDVKTGQLVQTLLGHSNEVNAVAFSRNGKLLASGSADSLVILWDAATGRQIQSFAGHQASIRAVAFSPNGQRLVSAGEDTKLLVWDTATRKLDKQIAGATNAINALAFNPLGNLIAGSEDGEIKEWDVNKGQTKQIISVPVQPQSNNSETIPTVSVSSIESVPAGTGQITQPISTPLATVTLSSIFNRVLDWLIPAAEAAIPNPPGGPILVVTTASDSFGKYYAEILRTEGFNEFAMADISTVNATTLAAYDVVILAQMTLTSAQVTMLTDWATAGGNLIAMRPNAQLADLLGVTASGTTLSNGYLLVDTSQAPGNGIVNQTLQFHGAADRYTVTSASSLATLYTNATTATTNPAVTLRSVGTNGGQAAAFTYDLATSIVYTRQGNPAWATQERDGFSPIRSDDKFFGNASGDPQADWIDFDKIAIPQADEQQRLLANLILEMNRDKKPLPRFWYFPRGKKAVVIMTGDDHGNNGTQGRFDQFKSMSPAGCSVANWECIRGTSYIYPNTPLTNAQAAAYNADGFEVGLHVNTNCADFTPASLRTFYTQQIGDFTTKYSSIPAPITQRHHCIAWSDWVTGAIVQLENAIRFDTSYYFWPPGWVLNRPGFFSGSGMPMRFVNLDGSMIDVYHAASQMTDESGQTYPFTIDTLLDRALGAEGYYGAYTINAHTDVSQIPEATTTVNSALARSVPVVSSKQMLDWLDGRNSSSFGSPAWNNGSLSFTVTAGAGANGLQAMLPVNSATGVLVGLTGPNGAVAYTTDIIKGIQYAFFTAAAGAYTATYGADTTPPTVTSTSPASGATGVIQQPTVTATFSESIDPATVTTSNFQLQTGSNPPVSATVSYDASTRTARLTPSTLLAGSTLYTATILTGIKDSAGNALAAPYTWSFTTQAQPCVSTPCNAWSSSTIPGTPSVNDPNAVELGVKFTVDLDGFITGIRFYKGSTNTGTHVGHLWTSAGAQMATATFSNETATGWQQVSFNTPVPVTAGTVYVASYYAPNGNYAATNSPEFGTSGVDAPPVHLLRDGVSGGNGVYLYGIGGGFPANTYQSTNYWVDVVFTTGTGPDTTPPTVVSTSPTEGATGINPTTAVTALFSEAMKATTITTSNFQLQTGNNPPVSATVTYAGNTATLTPNSALTANTTYTATVKGGAGGVQDLAGNTLAMDRIWSFTTGTDPCTSGGNPIVCENGKAGNPSSEWDIIGAGDLNIQGFATDISVNRGGTVNFKIKSVAAYRLDIYRMGYYGGNGARKVATITSLPSQTQPACMTNTTGLIDCGNWAQSASWAVPVDATSGIYFARAVRSDTGGASHIVFVVRDDAGTSKMLFQTSDTTWQAYNNYGGNSLYTGSGPGTGGNAVGRAYKVSYNRPFNTRAVDGGQDWVFNAEYPMVRWLEANGYDVSYFAGVDSDRRGNLISNHKVFLSVGHDEYWSGAQRTNVETARDATSNPVNLVFFSGNEVFWKTRWENSIDGSNTANRTLVCYKETHNFPNNRDPLDPPIWTGTWRDPRNSPPIGTADGGRPENALLGPIFMVNDGATTAITVPEADGKMRFWRNTSIATLTAGTTATLAGSTLGYEWDVDLDNGFRPAGLVRNSTTIVNNAPILTDYGSTFGSGTANHALTLYRSISGALVFGAGTVQWPWGLDSNHDRGSNPPDVRMQQATVNLFADMGVQPATLQSGLTAAAASADVTAPSSTITAPANGSTITSGSQVSITGTAADTGGGVVGGVEVSVDGGTTWHPANGRANWSYTWTANISGSVTIKSRAVDDSGILETPNAGISVTVGSGTSCTGSNCTIWPSATVPGVIDGGPDSAVELGVKFRADVSGTITGIRFYKAGTNTGTHVGNLWSSTGTLLASATFSGETASGWQQVLFPTPVAITANTVYVASYHANAGHYSADLNYFASTGVDSPPLHALSAGVSANGVYAYGATSAFPSQTFNSTNYWVDVVFSSSPPPTLTSIAVTPTNPAILTGATQSFTATGTYSDSSTQNLTSQVTWASSSTAVATINAGGLATGVSPGSTTISATSGSVSGNTVLTVNAAPLSITTTSLPNGTLNVAYPATTLTASGGTPPYTSWSIAGGALPPGLSLTTGAITGTPTATGIFNFTAQVSDSASPVGTATKALSITVATTTGFLAPSANAAVTVNAGDNNGFQTTPTNAYSNDGLFAVDTNSGTNTNTSCTNAGKDKHIYYNYGFNLPSGASIAGIQVRLDARVDATAGAPRMCVQLSWDGGSTWTAAKTTATLTTSEATYILGGAADTWGRAWTVSNVSDTGFRTRIINVASNTNRDFSLDLAAVQVTYQ